MNVYAIKTSLPPVGTERAVCNKAHSVTSGLGPLELASFRSDGEHRKYIIEAEEKGMNPGE